MRKQSLSLLFAALLLAGCASKLNRSPETPSQAAISPANPIVMVSISLTDEAKKQYKESRKFNQDELMRQVRRGLDANSLLSYKDESKRFPALEIRVKELWIRSNAAAAIFGVLAGTDYIVADVVLKGADGKVMDSFEVETSYAWGGLDAGQDNVRLNWLYENFTNELINGLVEKTS